MVNLLYYTKFKKNFHLPVWNYGSNPNKILMKCSLYSILNLNDSSIFNECDESNSNFETSTNFQIRANRLNN